MTTREKAKKTEKSLETRPARRMSPWDEMERWFGDFGRRGWLQPFNMDWPTELEGRAPFEGKCPKVDLIDRKKEVFIRAELPGATRDNVEVSVTDQHVTITAKTEHEEKQGEEDGKYYRHEISRGEYQRTLALPETVDGEKAKATFKNGVLELTLPKTKKTPRRTVKVE